MQNTTTLKGLPMKHTHFDDIAPNNHTDFAMLYFAACRSLRELEAAIRRNQADNLTCRQTWLLRGIQRKLFQIAAMWKRNIFTESA